MIAVYQDSTFNAAIQDTSRESMAARFVRGAIERHGRVLSLPDATIRGLEKTVSGVHVRVDQRPHHYEERLQVRIEFRFPDGQRASLERVVTLQAHLNMSKHTQQAKWRALEQALRLTEIEMLQLASAL